MATGTTAALALARDTLGVCERVLRPVLLLAVRLWLAGLFLQTSLATRGAGPVLGLEPLAFVEAVAAILLALGLMTRPAGMAAALLALLVHFGPGGQSGHLLCALLALGLAVGGPGRLSLDALIGEGLRRAPLPLSRWPERIYRAVERHGMPLLVLVLRLFMGWLFWAAGGAAGMDTAALVSAAALAPFMTEPATTAALLGAGVLLAVGLAGRLAALVLLAATLAVALGGQAVPEHALWVLVLALLLVGGPGPWSLDAPIDRWLTRRFPAYDGRPAFSLEGCPRVVIVGAGFGGLAAAKALSAVKARVTVIDRHNYHLFQPLLYQVATASLSPSDIAMPIRGLLRDQFNTRVLFAKVTGIDLEARAVVMGAEREPFDHLILATGARHAYFGRDEWEPLAPGLKKIDDATQVRQRILLAFERAETARDPDEARRLLTFVVVGGGPTGVELAGAIAELAKQGMDKDFRAIDPAGARVVLVQSAPRILPMFPETLSAAAAAALARIGVEVRTGARVTDMDETGICIGDQRLPAGTVLWAAGVRASRAAKWLGCPADRAGRVAVEPDLSVPGHANIFVVGDTAAATGPDGAPVPGLAPAAKQAGRHAARVITAAIEGQRHPGPFRYRHMGSLATIGRDAAIADFGRLRLSGHVAWWLWGAIHVLFLLGARNRLSVMLNWVWSYVSDRHSTRLITGPVPEPSEPVA